jgi:hypothetical protein
VRRRKIRTIGPTRGTIASKSRKYLGHNFLSPCILPLRIVCGAARCPGMAFSPQIPTYLNSLKKSRPDPSGRGAPHSQLIPNLHGMDSYAHLYITCRTGRSRCSLMSIPGSLHRASASGLSTPPISLFETFGWRQVISLLETGGHVGPLFDLSFVGSAYEV